jgi:hypothetical protein
VARGTLSVSQLAYGVRIEANILLPGLAAQSNQEPVDIRIQLKDSEVLSEPPDTSIALSCSGINPDPIGERKLRVRMLAGGKYYGFFYEDGARFAIEREGREVRGDWPTNYTLEDACTYLLGPVLGFVLRLRGVTCLHASAVVIDDYAVALAGSPGAGKSTTAAAFAQSGVPVLSDDIVALAESGDQFLVQPGYPRLNLWPDSSRMLVGEEGVLPRITPTWDKLYMPLDQGGRRFGAQPLPLRAIYVLGEREEHLEAPVIEEVTGSEALMTLVTNTYVNYLLDPAMRRRDFDVLSRVVAQMPIRRVRPAADPAKLYTLRDAIARDVARIAIRKPKITVLGAN